MEFKELNAILDQKREETHFILNDPMNDREIFIPKNQGDPQVSITNGGTNYVPLAEEVLAQVQHALLIHKETNTGNDSYDQKMSKAVEILQDKLNKVNAEFKKKSTTADKNKYLDQQREVLTQEMLQEIQSNSEININIVNNERWKALWKSRPAHTNFLITKHTQGPLAGLVSYIEPSKHTAHSKSSWGIDVASRKIQFYQNGKKIFETIRTPSLSDPESKAQQDIKNIVIRMGKIHASAGDQNKPIIYNLLTSLHQPGTLEHLFDMLETKQNISAERILKSAHKYNKQQFKNNKTGLFYVQNLGVNGFSVDLSNSHTTELIQEATLMADMAILETLYHEKAYENLFIQKPGTTPGNIKLLLFKDNMMKDIHNKYKEYCEGDQNTPLCKSKQGQNIKQSIKLIKESFKKNENFPQTENNATQVLTQIFAKDLHYDQTLGSIVQTISMKAQFEQGIQQCNGCKSANERFEMILNQVLILVTSSNIDYPKLENLEKELKDCSDKINNKLNKAGGYTPCNGVSTSDQSAGSKIKTERRGMYKASKIGLIVGLGVIAAGIAIAAAPITVGVGAIAATVGAGSAISTAAGFSIKNSGTNYAGSKILTNQSNKNVQQQHKKQPEPINRAVEKLGQIQKPQSPTKAGEIKEANPTIEELHTPTKAAVPKSSSIKVPTQGPR